MQNSNLPELSPLQVGVRFQSPVKRIPMEIFGQYFEEDKRMLLVGEVAKLLLPDYSGINISEQELLAKIEKKEIELIKKTWM